MIKRTIFGIQNAPRMDQRSLMHIINILENQLIKTRNPQPYGKAKVVFISNHDIQQITYYSTIIYGMELVCTCNVTVFVNNVVLSL